MAIARRLFLAASFAAVLGGCATSNVPPGAREALAPTGTLRIAVYPGSPTSLVERAAPEQMRGVAVDLGRALAARIGVPSQVVIHQRVAEVVSAVQRGEADFTITNSTAERQQLLDFAQPVVDLELGVLAPAGSRLTATDRMDSSGFTIGVSQGSSSERALGARFKEARLRAYPSLDAAAASLRAGEIDGFATNKGILYELAEKVPNARVLGGRWGTEHLGLAIPKGRAPAALAYLRAFTDEMRSGGELDRAVQRAALRGTTAPSP